MKQAVLVPFDHNDLSEKSKNMKTHDIGNFWVGLLDMENFENH